MAAESQKADPLTRLAAAAEQDFDILEEEQESDNSPGWHTETQGQPKLINTIITVQEIV